MCGRYVAGSDEMTWREWVQVLRPIKPPATLPERPVRPGSIVPAILRDDQGAVVVCDAVWGLRMPGPDKKLYFNTRMETVLKRFAAAARQRRCLLPARSFDVAEGNSAARARTRHRATAPSSMFLAGIWDPSDDAPHRRVSVLTRASQGPLAALHDRSPVLVPLPRGLEWIQGDDPAAIVAALLEGRDPELRLTPAS